MLRTIPPMSRWLWLDKFKYVKFEKLQVQKHTHMFISALVEKDRSNISQLLALLVAC